jgi:tetratricopeptide (TPR) repeat protein
MTIRCLKAFLCLAIAHLALSAPSARAADLTILNPRPPVLPICGSHNSVPLVSANERRHRSCGPRAARNYTPRNRGIGFKILDLESEACFVPDEAYRLLDEIVDEVRRRLALVNVRTSRRAKVQAIGRITGEVMKDRGFVLSLPTDTLGDTLVTQNTAGGKPRHIFDCDTGSMIYLTVADALSTPASLVEIMLPSGDQHNYVQWQIGRAGNFAWDPNAPGQCVKPATARGYQGRSLTYGETISYALTLRADLWIDQKAFARAIDDYKEAIRLFPQRPGGYAGLAWMLATKEFPERSNYKRLAITSAKQAVRLRRNADNLDTLACVYAFIGDFDSAVTAEREALTQAPANADYLRRIEAFSGNQPIDCGPAK